MKENIKDENNDDRSAKNEDKWRMKSQKLKLGRSNHKNAEGRNKVQIITEIWNKGWFCVNNENYRSITENRWK